ncbi:MAG: transposase, partial [Sphingomonadales bacterium]
MRIDLENLPSDVDLLHRLVRDMAAVAQTRDDEITRLQHLIKQLQHARFGRRSERLDPDQMALGLEDLDTDIGEAQARLPVMAAVDPDHRPRRAPLPEHLHREETVIDVESRACPCCGGRLHPI